MAKAKKLPSGNWRVQVYSHTETVNGVEKKRYKSFTAGSKKEAEYLAAQWKIEHEDKKEHPLQYITFQDAYDAFIEDAESKGVGENTISPTTIRGFQGCLKKALAPILDVPLGNLADGVLLQALMDKNAKTYKPKSVHNQKDCVAAVFRFFNIDMPKLDLPSKAAVAAHELPLPNKKECYKIVQVLEGSDIECEILLALTCSLRQSEIAGIRPKNIKDGVLHVCGTRVLDKNNQFIFRTLNKNNASNRMIQLTPELDAKLKARCAGYKPDEFVFNKKEQIVLKSFQRLLKRNGLPPYTVHGMRHAFAAWMSSDEARIPEATILKLGGWATSNVFKKVYRYSFNEDEQKAVNAARGMFSPPDEQNVTKSE